MKTETKHTPGPWHLMEFGGDEPAISISPVNWPNKIKYWIANVPLAKAHGAGASIQDCGATTEEARANAALIASAPDLLAQRDELREALRDLITHDLMCCETDGQEPGEMCRKAQAALAKCEPKGPQWTASPTVTRGDLGQADMMGGSDLWGNAQWNNRNSMESFIEAIRETIAPEPEYEIWTIRTPRRWIEKVQRLFDVAMRSKYWDIPTMTKLQKARSDAGKKASREDKQRAAHISWNAENLVKRAQNLIRRAAESGTTAKDEVKSIHWSDGMNEKLSSITDEIRVA